MCSLTYVRVHLPFSYICSMYDIVYCLYLFQLLSSLRVIQTLPPLTSTTTSHKTIRDIHKQVASGLLELLQAHSSDLHTPNEWSVVFSVMEFAGTGLILYENKEDIASSSPINLEMISVDTGFQDGSVVATESCSIPCEDDGIQSDWVWVEEVCHHQIILPNSFDLLSEESIPIHDPQVINLLVQCITNILCHRPWKGRHCTCFRVRELKLSVVGREIFRNFTLHQ